MIENAIAAEITIAVTKPSNLAINELGPFITGAISIILVIAVFAAFIYLVWGGIQWITSGGDKSATESARNRIQNAILGLFIVFAAWAVMKIVSSFLGFEFPNFRFQTGY